MLVGLLEEVNERAVQSHRPNSIMQDEVYKPNEAL